jgi:hypothetical protein
MAMVGSTACDLPGHLPWRGRRERGAHRRVLKTSSRLLAVALLAGATVWSSAALDRELISGAEFAELIYLPPTGFLRAVSLGYEQALADVLWFRTISYFGRHYQGDRVYPWLASMCDGVTDLDPHAEHVYQFGGIILPWEADRIDDGIALLEKGTRNMPDSWQLHYMLGFSYYFFRDDLDGASRLLHRASFLPGAPEFVSRLAASVDAAHRGPSRAVDFLLELEQRDVHGEMRAVIRERIGELSLSADIDSLEAAAQSFRARTGRRPVELDELVTSGIIARIPEEPFGGRYVLDRVSGRVVSSSGHRPWHLGRSQLRNAFLKARHSGD